MNYQFHLASRPYGSTHISFDDVQEGCLPESITLVSYNTSVLDILKYTDADGEAYYVLVINGYYSPTTQRHISLFCGEFGITNLPNKKWFAKNETYARHLNECEVERILTRTKHYLCYNVAKKWTQADGRRMNENLRKYWY